MAEELMRLEKLEVTIRTKNGEIHPVDGIDMRIPERSVVGLVGESGCGKSMTAMSIMRLLPASGRISGGSIVLDGEEISQYSDRQMRELTGNKMSIIFQEPMTSLNPVVRVGKQVEEVLKLHTNLKKAERRSKVIEMFRLVGIPEPEERYLSYPFQLSGGLRQRIMIAMAMICNPKLLIADEPTTALDVTIEAQILHLMRTLRDETGTSILMITHNLGVVAELCDWVYVMYMGQIVESTDTLSIFDEPLHPYTRGLIRSVPKIQREQEPLQNIPGMVPNMTDVPKGCRFCPRCSCAMELCEKEQPQLYRYSDHHQVRCFLYEKAGTDGADSPKAQAGSEGGKSEAGHEGGPK
ncbi:MAG: ABC transporter ATP-binding protein [Lachnospiraceae bacterium]|nr:ABC transporter ATP-binding protein [Lachnospiraceae bacterium]